VVAPRVADVTDDTSGREAFHAVAEAAYASQPPGTMPARRAVERSLGRETFRGAQRLFLALDGTRAVARVVARVSPQLRDDTGSPYGMLGFFEAEHDQEAVDLLLRAGTDWLRSRGARRVVGPMDGDTWHRYRVNAGPFARPPFPLEPWNPPYYQELWEGAGFEVLESYSSKWIDDVSVLLPKLEAGVERSRSRGVRIRGLDRSRIADELATVHMLSTEIFREAFLYTPIAREEFLSLYAGIERFLDPDLVVFAEAAEGAPVGFVFAYADPTQSVVHYKTIGVLERWRRSAVAAALSHHVYSNAIRKGLRSGNHALMRDDNRSQALDQDRGEVFRRYLLYERRA